MAAGTIIAKVSAAAVTDKGSRNFVLIIITAIIMPVIIVVFILAAVISGGTEANNSLLGMSFGNADIPETFTAEQKSAIEYMREQLGNIDEIIAGKEKAADYDVNMVKAVFYCLQFGTVESDDAFDMEPFCDCFAGIAYSEIGLAYENIAHNFPDITITDNVKLGVQSVYNYLAGGEK